MLSGMAVDTDQPAWLPGSKQEAFAKRVFALDIERAAAKRILKDIVEQGLTPELREKASMFLERHPD